MKLCEWARKHGISYKTAWRWVKLGKMPIEQSPTVTILVKEPEEVPGVVALLARVSSGS
jgi:putative resolvase